MENVKQFISKFLQENLIETNKGRKPTQLVFIAGYDSNVLFKDIELNPPLFVQELKRRLTTSLLSSIVFDGDSDSIKLVQTDSISKDDLLLMYTEIFKVINLLHGSEEAIEALEQYVPLFLAATNTAFENLSLPN